MHARQQHIHATKLRDAIDEKGWQFRRKQLVGACHIAKRPRWMRWARHVRLNGSTWNRRSERNTLGISCVKSGSKRNMRRQGCGDQLLGCRREQDLVVARRRKQPSGKVARRDL